MKVNIRKIRGKEKVLLIKVRIGILIYTNGDKYEGEFKDDKKEGKGNSLTHQ